MTVSLIIIGLTTLFAIASFVLFLSKGKSKFWTAKKMKLGAMLLTFTAVTGLSSCNGDEEMMCYATAELKDWVNIENFKDTIDLKENTELKGKIEYRSSDVYSYKLKNDFDSTVHIHGLLKADDGIFNDSTEQFILQLDTNLSSGTYTLSFYDTGLDSVGYSIADYHFKIKNDE